MILTKRTNGFHGAIILDTARRNKPVASKIKAFFKLFNDLSFGLPDVLMSISTSTETVQGMAKLAIYGGYMSKCGKGDFYVYCCPIDMLVFLAEGRVRRSHLLLPEVFEVVVAALELEKPRRMFVTSGYLACLLLLCESVLWPSECATREDLMRVVIAVLRDIEFLGGTASWHVIDHRTLLPVLELANHDAIPAVSAFGMWCLTFVCSDAFAEFSAPPHYYGRCPMCLIKREIGLDPIRSLTVPRGFEGLKIDLEAVVSRCNDHNELHLFN
eukprot:m.298785 g.298785  ORF g.298785 m.298785 type:complete len:271 (+) comp40783_c0_seq7:1685-2497(+)